MLLVVRRLQELGRERKSPLYICFIDLHKSYDYVDRQLLWEVLQRFGVPAKMLEVSASSTMARVFACAQTTGRIRDGLTSRRGFKQGCVLLPTLFSMFFAAAPHAILVHFSKDEGIVLKLVHLNDDKAGMRQRAVGASAQSHMGQRLMAARHEEGCYEEHIVTYFPV